MFRHKYITFFAYCGNFPYYFLSNDNITLLMGCDAISTIKIILYYCFEKTNYFIC